MPLLEGHVEPLFKSMETYAQTAKAGEADLGPTKMCTMNLKRNALQKAYLDRWMATASSGEQPMDGIIMAVTRLGQTQKTFYVGYTGVFHLLG